MTPPENRRGLLAGISAYALWGVFPLYFVALKAVGALEIVAHRAVWGLVVCLLILLVTRHWESFTRLWRSPRTVGLLALAAALLAVNWLVYVLSVVTGRTLDASLGYYLNPLVTVMLGVLVLGERMRRLQWCALALGTVAVAWLMMTTGSTPWISLALAFSFGLYGLVKKQVGARVGAVEGMAVETVAMLVPALGYLTWLHLHGGGSFATGIDSGLPPGMLEVLLVLSGAVTTAPLLLFAVAAKILPLSTVGLIQYLTPTVQFLLAWLVLGEPMPAARWIGFLVVWAAVLLISADMLRATRRSRAARRPAAPRA